MKEKQIDDDLTLRVMTCTRDGQGYSLSNPRILSGWQEIRVTRGIEILPSSFEVRMTEKYGSGLADEMDVQPGDFCEVFLGGDLVITGWVDQWLGTIANGEHEITLIGRSKCADLVDCSAVHDGYQISNAPVSFIARELCEPFSVGVSLAPGTNEGDPVPQLVILAGETPYDIIERVCRYRGLLMYDTPDGNLLLSGIGSGRAASGFEEGVNVERANVGFRNNVRFSDYYALYQGIDLFSDAGDAPNQISHVHDSSVYRYRPRVILAENVIGGASVTKARAQWEADRRYGRSFAVTLTTDSWRDSAGVLYTPNTYVPLMLSVLKLGLRIVNHPAYVNWIIAEVTYRRGRDGTHADIVIMPPDAFRQQPIQLLPPIPPDQSNK